MTDSADRDADQLQLQLADSLISLSLASVHEPRPAAPPRTAVLFQPACTLHRYIRTTDDSTIVERPQRIRAVKVGVAAAWARLEQLQHLGANDDDDRLDQLLQGLTLAGGNGSKKSQRGGDFKGKGRARQVLGGGGGGPFDILDSDAQLPVDHAALRYVHPKPNQPPDNDNDEGGWESASDSSSPSGAEADAGPSSKPSSAPPPWPEQLQSLCRASSSSLHPPSPSTSPRKSSTTRTTSEIPPHLSQGDLYLCPGSEPAIFGALGACCEAVDRIVAGGGGGAGVAAQQQQQTANVSEDQQDAATSYDRAFVAIRPPGHHCGEANPQGFCFVNNVAVAAAHAHIEHGIDRVVILDIDLHHGNGTQEIAWRINAEAHEILEAREQEAQRRAAAALKTPRSSPRKSSPRKMGGGMPIQKGVKEEEEEGEERKKEGKEKEAKDPLRIMYASLHDIWSYPCEDGDPTLVAAASLSLNGGHGQYISNVHLEPWNSEVDFHERLYPKYREGLIERAEDFVRLTRGADELEEEEGARGKKTLVIVSLGCDASEHESAGMSRHNRNVPTSFYRRFALDATSFAHHHAAGKCLAVLEGGYSDRALASASAAFLSGFADRVPSSANNDNDRKPTDRFTVSQERDGWWSEPHLKKLEKACSVAKTRRGGGAHSSPSVPGLLVGADGGTASATTRDPWLARAVEVFAHLEDTAVASSISSSLAPGSSGSILHSDPNTPRQLRDRTKSRPINYAALADGSSPLPSPVRGALTSTSTRPPSASNRLRGDAAPSSSEEEVSTTSLPPPVPVLPPAFASAADEAPSAAPSDPPPHPAQPVFAFTSPDSETPIHESAPSSVPAATTPEAVFGDAGEERAEESAPVKPAIRFTWKQGGFGGEPRM